MVTPHIRPRAKAALVLILIAVLCLPAVALADGRTPTGFHGSPRACARAQDWVDDVRRSVVRTKRALRRADTQADKRVLRERLRIRRAILREARAREARVCHGIGTPAPQTEPPPSGSLGQPPGHPDPPNSPPYFPKGQVYTDIEHYVAEDDVGAVQIATTTFVVKTPAVDPDGDPLTYSWSATTGVIVGEGLNAIWQRAIEFGFRVPGTVTLTASDGKGGTTQLVFPPPPETAKS